MTFFEAAVQVLREAGRPLHFKKITDQAIQRDLLSHVGKTPEDTMNARLAQESAKPSTEAVIVEVRPGVFGLRDGVDLDDAGETITLRAPAVDAPEPEPVTDDAEPDEEAGPVAAPAVLRPTDDDRRRGRRRPRRGGRRGGEDSSSDETHDAEGDDDEAPVSVSVEREVADTARDRTLIAPSLDSTEDLGDVAAAAVRILLDAGDRPLSASKVAKELERAGVGGLGSLGTTALRSTLGDANARRARAGRPPVFEEVKPNFWSLATATGSSLAASYAALDRWQARHRGALVDALLDHLVDLDSASLSSLTTLLLDRLGYTGITAYPGDARTVSARSPNRLTPTTVAVRIFRAGEVVGREAVAALRGSLHQFGSAAGVMFALGDVERDIGQELSVPNVAPITLLDGPAIAELMVGAGVGVARFSVDVSCLDDALFRELRND